MVDEAETSQKMAQLGLEKKDDTPREAEQDVDDIEHDERLEEFRSIMKQRFLDGEDAQFFDYASVDSAELPLELCKWREQDAEDSYFDAD